MAELERFDECGWERASLTDTVTGAKYGQQGGPAASLNFSPSDLPSGRRRSATFSLPARRPNDFYEINDFVGTEFNGFMRSIQENDLIPTSVYAARDAGLNFADSMTARKMPAEVVSGGYPVDGGDNEHPTRTRDAGQQCPRILTLRIPT